MKYGWEKLTTIFKKKKFGKEKRIKIHINEHILNLLASIREYIVDKYFYCINNNRNNIYLPVGSKNITSDYDIEIIGKDSPEIVWKMFNKFLNQYNNSLPFVFDTNLYSVGLYTKEGSINIKEKVLIPNENIFTLSPKTKNDILFCINIALLKIINLKIDLNYKYIHKHLKESKKIKNDTDSKFKNEFDNQKKKYKNKYTKNTLDLITSYKLNYNYAKKVFSILYNKKISNKLLLKLICYAQYYSIESYYTPCTINVVVFKLQQQSNIKITQIDYLCSLIENLGDLNHHLTEEYKHEKNIKQLLIKYSKYIYRLYYSIGNLNNYKIYLSKANKINKNIIPFRGEINQNNKINYYLLNYNNEKTIEKYLEKFNKNILIIINDSLHNLAF
jgi:hypothetical protein